MTNNQQISLSDSIEENQLMMKKIASNQQSLEDIKNLTSSKVTDQLKVFLVSQARNELSRIIKLTVFLDKLESKFMEKVDENINSDSLTLKQYSDTISVITSLLSRSNDIVSKVLNDDSLTTILNTTIYTSEGSQTSAVVSSLKDPQSRERVRLVIQQVISKINLPKTSYDKEDVVEIKEDSESDSFE